MNMSIFTTPPCSRRSLHFQPEAELPAANADNRAVILWLENVLFHGKMLESADSRKILSQLAENIPVVCFSNAVPLLSIENNPDLAAAIAAVKNFAEQRIEDAQLSKKADLAIRSISSQFSSPIQVISPNRVFKSMPEKRAVSESMLTPRAKRRLNFED